jgi:hypothetical protein
LASWGGKPSPVSRRGRTDSALLSAGLRRLAWLNQSIAPIFREFVPEDLAGLLKAGGVQPDHHT